MVLEVDVQPFASGSARSPRGLGDEFGSDPQPSVAPDRIGYPSGDRARRLAVTACVRARVASE